MTLNILLVSRNLPPMIGGMEKLNWHMADELSQYCNLTIIGPAQAEISKPLKAKFIGTKLTPLWHFLISTIWLTYITAKKTKPDIILAGSGLSALATLIASRLSGAKSAVYVHGLDIAVDHPIYKLIWLPAIKNMDLIIANSRATAELVKKIGVFDERIHIVHPGVSRPKETPNISDIENFRKSHQLEKQSILLSVGRLTHRKGLIEFVSQSLPIIIKQQPNTVLLVIGSSPNNSLHAKEVSPGTVLQAARKANVEKNIKFIGAIDERNLALAFQTSSTHIFPIREISGDPEGFGMVAIEAAAHGIPTIAFSTGGVVDAVKEGESGFLVESNNYQKFAELTLKLMITGKEMKKSCMAFSEEFAWHNFGKKIIAILNPINDTNFEKNKFRNDSM